VSQHHEAIPPRSHQEFVYTGTTYETTCEPLNSEKVPGSTCSLQYCTLNSKEETEAKRERDPHAGRRREGITKFPSHHFFDHDPTKITKDHSTATLFIMYLSTKTEANQRGLTSWHPIQTTASEDLWEIPHVTRNLNEDDDTNENQNISSIGKEADRRGRTSWHQSQTPANEDLWEIPHLVRTYTADDDEQSENQSISPSWSSNSENQHYNTTNNAVSSRKKKSALGDATNTAPVLQVRRSRFP
jgi:hypothetical protein